MPETLSHPRRVKLADAARQNGVCTKTLRRMIARGDLPAHRLGSRIILVDLDDLDAILAPLPATKAAS